MTMQSAVNERQNQGPESEIRNIAAQVRKSARQQQRRAVGLTLPLLAFVAFTFLLPVVSVLWFSVYSPEVRTRLPETAEKLRDWEGAGLPSNEIALALSIELAIASHERTIGKLARRLNFNIGGFRSLLIKTGKAMRKHIDKNGLPVNADGALVQLIDIDERWGERKYWAVLEQSSGYLTPYFLLQSIDLNLDENSGVVASDDTLYIHLLARTFWISVVVTFFCLVLGYPLAFLLATVGKRYRLVLMLLLLLPLWTSILVRTTAWLVLLQDGGLINTIGKALGLWDEPIALIRNRIGVYVAMVHIMLPFMILPIYSVMKGIEPNQIKAAATMGAKPLRAFWKVYLPQTYPGLGAGLLIVFILCLSFYITPVLVGGVNDQMISYYISYNATDRLNWGLAAGLSLVLMACVGIFLVIYQRLAATGRIQAGF